VKGDWERNCEGKGGVPDQVHGVISGDLAICFQKLKILLSLVKGVKGGGKEKQKKRGDRAVENELVGNF